MISGEQAAVFIEEAVLKLLKERLVVCDFGSGEEARASARGMGFGKVEEDEFIQHVPPKMGGPPADPSPPTNPDYRAKSVSSAARSSARVAEDSVYMNPSLCPPDRSGGRATAPPLRPAEDPPRPASYADPTRNPTAFFVKGEIENPKGKEVVREGVQRPGIASEIQEVEEVVEDREDNPEATSTSAFFDRSDKYFGHKPFRISQSEWDSIVRGYTREEREEERPKGRLTEAEWKDLENVSVGEEGEEEEDEEDEVWSQAERERRSWWRRPTWEEWRLEGEMVLGYDGDYGDWQGGCDFSSEGSLLWEVETRFWWYDEGGRIRIPKLTPTDREIQEVQIILDFEWSAQTYAPLGSVMTWVRRMVHYPSERDRRDETRGWQVHGRVVEELVDFFNPRQMEAVRQWVEGLREACARDPEYTRAYIIGYGMVNDMIFIHQVFGRVPGMRYVDLQVLMSQGNGQGLGLEGAVRQLLGYEMPMKDERGCQRSMWHCRPLSLVEEAYAMGDVRNTAKVLDRLGEITSREDWERCFKRSEEMFEGQHEYVPRFSPVGWKLGPNSSARQRALIRWLWEVRRRQARRADVNHGEYTSRDKIVCLMQVLEGEWFEKGNHSFTIRFVHNGHLTLEWEEVLLTWDDFQRDSADLKWNGT